MNIRSLLYRDDSTLYFILNDESKSKVLKQSLQIKICKKISEHMGVRFSHMASGSDVRHGMSLKSDFQQKITDQVGIIYVDIAGDMITLLSAQQRDMFFDEILALEEDADTLPMVQKILDETKENCGHG